MTFLDLSSDANGISVVNGHLKTKTKHFCSFYNFVISETGHISRLSKFKYFLLLYVVVFFAFECYNVIEW